MARKGRETVTGAQLHDGENSSCEPETTRRSVVLVYRDSEESLSLPSLHLDSSVGLRSDRIPRSDPNVLCRLADVPRSSATRVISSPAIASLRLLPKGSPKQNERPEISCRGPPPIAIPLMADATPQPTQREWKNDRSGTGRRVLNLALCFASSSGGETNAPVREVAL